MAYKKGPPKPTRYDAPFNPTPINDQPAQGSAGILWTNAFQVNLPSSLKVYRYKVNVSPPWPNKRIRQHMMNKLLATIQGQYNVNAASNMFDQVLTIEPIPTGEHVLPHPKKEKMDIKRKSLQSTEAQTKSRPSAEESSTPGQRDEPEKRQSQQSIAATRPSMATPALPFMPPKPNQPMPSPNVTKSATSGHPDPTSLPDPQTLAEVGDYDFKFVILPWGDDREGTLDFADLLVDIKNKATAEDKADYMAALNLLLRRGPSRRSEVVAIGHERLFDTSAPVFEDLGSGLELRTGFFTSFRTVPERLILNINTNRAAFYKPIPLTILIDEWCVEFRRQTGQDFFIPHERWRRNPVTELDRFLRGIVIETTHLKAHFVNGKLETGKLSEERHGTITGLARTDEVPQPGNTFFDWTPDDALVGQEPQKITVGEYFAKHKGRKLIKHGLVVQVGSRGTLYPAEVCTVMPAQHAQRRLVGEMKDYAVSQGAANPLANVQAIVSRGLPLVQGPRSGPNNLEQQFRIRINPDLLSVNAKLLSMPTIEYGNGQIVTPHKVKGGQWNLQNFEFLKPANGPGVGEDPYLKNITWIHVPIRISGKKPEVKHNHRIMFQNKCTEYLNTNGFRHWIVGYHDDDSLITVNGFRDMEQERASLNELRKHFRTFKADNVKLCFILLDSRDADLYNAIKQVADVELGLHTVCVVARRPSKYQVRQGNSHTGIQFDGDTFGNLLMKVNLKMGGVNSRLTSLPKFITDATMFVGLDVTHPSAAAMEGAPSVAAAVATFDKHMAQWPASLRQQKHWIDDNAQAQEIILDLEEMMKERLDLWLEHNDKTLPEQVIIYRDGLSEGQFQQCIDQELESVRDAITSIQKRTSVSCHPNGPPKLLLICAVKRHHHRFYPEGQALDDGNGNPIPGICVDGGVTYDPSSGFKDWFSQSHKAIKGTARPAHYVILHQDNKDIKFEEIQTMTHHMSFQFGRCTKSVKVHPAVYYADLAAERARCYLHRVYNPWPVKVADPKSTPGPATGKNVGKGGKQQQAGQQGKDKGNQIQQTSAAQLAPAKKPLFKQYEKPPKPKFDPKVWKDSTTLNVDMKDTMFYI